MPETLIYTVVKHVTARDEWQVIVPHAEIGQIVSVKVGSAFGSGSGEGWDYGKWRTHYAGNLHEMGPEGRPHTRPRDEYLFPDAWEGELIGKDADGNRFHIARGVTFSVKAAGPIWAAMNDIPNNFGDNAGEVILNIHLRAC